MPEDFQDEYVEQIRGADEVARRCIVLHAVLAVGHDEPRDEIVAWLRREGLWSSVSPLEADFLLAELPSDQQYINATWRAESLYALLWALGLVADLPSPTQLCDLQFLKSLVPPLLGSVGAFILSTRLRADAEIHDANEQIYQIHWRVRDAQFRNEPTPTGKLARMSVADSEPPAESYDAGVVQERHYALNWLIGYCGQEWDAITTDT
jgi:hypothetical protein